MEIQNRILQNLPLEEPEALDTLLEIAQWARELLRERRYEEVCALIRYTVAHSHYEAFFWMLGIVEELCEQEDAAPESFACEIGRSIPDYREFIARLQVDLNAVGNDVFPIPDEHGEVQSFFNILVYKTGFPHTQLVSSENYDAKDNDYIQYKLVFSGNG